MTQVSKKFYNFVQEPCVHVSVVLHNNVDIRSAVEFLKKSKQMTKLELVKSKVNFSHNIMTLATSLVIRTVIEYCPNVRELLMPSITKSWVMDGLCFNMFTNSGT